MKILKIWFDKESIINDKLSEKQLFIAIAATTFMIFVAATSVYSIYDNQKYMESIQRN